MAFHAPKPRRSLQRSNSERSLELRGARSRCCGSWWRKDATPFDRLDRRLWKGRLVFITCLIVAAVMLGTFSHKTLADSEQELADSIWQSVSKRALIKAVDVINAHRSAALTAASLASELKPLASDWNEGFVVLEGFEQMASNALLPLQQQQETSDENLATTRDIKPELLFVPFVSSANINEWNSFATEHYYENEQLPAPTHVWGWEENQRYPYDGNTTWDSSNADLVAPVFQANEGIKSPWLFYNFHASETEGGAIDSLVECVAHSNFHQATRDQVDRECASLLRLTHNSHLQDSTDTPLSHLMQPILPAREPSLVRVLDDCQQSQKRNETNLSHSFALPFGSIGDWHHHDGNSLGATFAQGFGR